MDFFKKIYDTIIKIFQQFVDPENGIFKPIKDFFDGLFKQGE